MSDTPFFANVSDSVGRVYAVEVIYYTEFQKLQSELAACQSDLAKAQAGHEDRDVVIVEAMHELGAQEGESLLNLARRKAKELARYADAEKGLPEEPEFEDGEVMLGDMLSYTEKLRTYAIAQTARVKELTTERNSYKINATVFQDRTKKAEAERDAAVRDAERYRNMRSRATYEYRNGPGIYWYLPRWNRDLPVGERLDSAIDASIKAEGGKHES